MFTFKKSSTENHPKQRSPRKRHLVSIRNRLLESSMHKSIQLQTIVFKINYYIVYENCNRQLSENVLLEEKIKVLEEDKNNLEEEVKCKDVNVDDLQNRLFTYDNLITDEQLFRVTIGLEVKKFKFFF